MKILTEKYPAGSIGNKTDGRYIDGTLYENLKVPAKKIAEDHSFLAVIFSSTLENGTGKSVFAQQLAEAWIDLVNQYHNLDLDLSMRNITFRPKDLIERSFKVPRFSPIILDEWEDANYWSELGMSLRQFFRKCRQLNLFIIVIIPNFFQLPMNYAISRSYFAVDIKFENGLERGYFDFYSFKAKKDLYIKGKKFQNYSVTRASFSGRFAKGYVVDEQKYRRAKYLDMLKSEKEEQRKTPKQIERETTILLFRKVYQNLKISIKDLSLGFGISERTGNRYIQNYKDADFDDSETDSDTMPSNYNNLKQGEVIYGNSE